MQMAYDSCNYILYRFYNRLRCSDNISQTTWVKYVVYFVFNNQSKIFPLPQQYKFFGLDK